MATLSEAELDQLWRAQKDSSDITREFGPEVYAELAARSGEYLLGGAYANTLESVQRLLLDYPTAINFVDPATGMNALHIAVGRNHLDMARYLVEHGIDFLPDNQGRMPTTIAAECEVSDEMCDFIAEAEAMAESV
jgi:ankyrin repeat protein